MKREVFDKIVEERIIAIRSGLLVKGREYQRNEDVLHNFERGSNISGEVREKLIWNFALKHYISILDMIDDISIGELPPKEYVEEKLGDLINYSILLEASIKEKIEAKKSELPF